MLKSINFQRFFEVEISSTSSREKNENHIEMLCWEDEKGNYGSTEFWPVAVKKQTSKCTSSFMKMYL